VPHLDRNQDPFAPHSLSPSELKELLAIEREGEPFLAFRDEAGGLGLFPVGHLEQSHTLGRRPEMGLSIPWDASVSGLHAELQGRGGEWSVVDDGLSTNGTYVDGQRVSGRRRLRDEDRVRIGHTILVYRAGGLAPVKETVATSGEPLRQELTDAQRRVLVALCRPLRDGSEFTTPATNQQIAEELFLSVDAVKMHLRTLFAKFELTDLAQNEKRARLAECALQFGVIAQRDLI
jgi:pSer/pThr/pTyr-binding forkhead associated (FHA) protein